LLQRINLIFLILKKVFFFPFHQWIENNLLILLDDNANSQIKTESINVKKTIQEPTIVLTDQQKLFLSRLKELKNSLNTIENPSNLTEEEKSKFNIKFNNPLSKINLGNSLTRVD
jgi:hypothetical protein